MKGRGAGAPDTDQMNGAGGAACFVARGEAGTDLNFFGPNGEERCTKKISDRRFAPIEGQIASVRVLSRGSCLANAREVGRENNMSFCDQLLNGTARRGVGLLALGVEVEIDIAQGSVRNEKQGRNGNSRRRLQDELVDSVGRSGEPRPPSSRSAAASRQVCGFR